MFFTFAAAIGGLAQLVRALAWHARGREFESRILHHFLRVIVVFSGGYFHFNGIRFYALVKPTVLPFRRPERRSTAADVRPRTPRDPRNFSANRSSAQPTYNCRPHPLYLHLHLRLRIETADNLQRGAESPRSESYPKHVRSHDLPRPLPTLRAPQTTPPPDRIPPGSTALPQTVRERSATIPPPLSPHSRTVCFHPFPAPFLPRIQTRNESLPSLPKQVRSRRTGYFLSRRKPLRLAGVARRRLPHTLLQANRPMARDKAPSGLLFFPLPFRRNQPKIRVFRDPIPAYASGTAPKSVAPTAVDPKTSPRRHGQQRSSRRPFSGARHLPGIRSARRRNDGFRRNRRYPGAGQAGPSRRTCAEYSGNLSRPDRSLFASVLPGTARRTVYQSRTQNHPP